MASVKLRTQVLVLAIAALLGSSVPAQAGRGARPSAVAAHGAAKAKTRTKTSPPSSSRATRQGARLAERLRSARPAKARKGLRLRARIRAQRRALNRQPPGLIRSITLEAPKLTVRALRQNPRLFLKGLVLDGPKHMLHSIREQKLAFFGGLGGVAVLGGLSKAYGFSIEPGVIAASLTLLAFQAKETVQYVRNNRLGPAETARVMGERFAFPMLVVNSATVLGVSLGHGGEAGHHSTMQAFTSGAVANGLIGGDSPAIAATILAERNAARRRAAAPASATSP